MDLSRSVFFIYFWSFQTSIQYWQQINVKNDPSCSRHHWDSNSRPLTPKVPPPKRHIFGRAIFLFYPSTTVFNLLSYTSLRSLIHFQTHSFLISSCTEGQTRASSNKIINPFLASLRYQELEQSCFVSATNRLPKPSDEV